MKLDTLTETDTIIPLPKIRDFNKKRWRVDVGQLKELVSNSSYGILNVGSEFYAYLISGWILKNFEGYETKVTPKSDWINMQYLVHFCKR